MLLGIIFASISAILIGLGIKLKDNVSESVQGVAIGSFVIGLFSGVIGWVILGCIGVNLITRSRDMYEGEQSRAILVRMLKENYNEDNLKKALDFNRETNITRRDNEGLWYRYLNGTYVLDTIAIPDSKFTPTLKVVGE